MTFILIVSITINMVAILAIVLLYMRQNRLIQFEKNYKEYVKELEDLMNTFIIEMKEENEGFKQLVKTRISFESPTELNSMTDEKADEDQSVIAVQNGYLQKTALNAYKNTKRDIVGDNIEKEAKSEHVDHKKEQNYLLNEVLELKYQGRTVEQIARKLGRGKTEINLLLKLNQK